jgi:hypothetical protein
MIFQTSLVALLAALLLSLTGCKAVRITASDLRTAGVALTGLADIADQAKPAHGQAAHATTSADTTTTTTK